MVSEKNIVKPEGSKGRIDIHVTADDNLVCVAEIKKSDWDAMTDNAVKRNISCHVKQIWEYIESQLGEGKDVSPGIIFHSAPANLDLRQMIENEFNENGIQVVWENE